MTGPGYGNANMTGIDKLLRRASILCGVRSARPLSSFERWQLHRLSRVIGAHFDAMHTPAELAEF